VHPGTGHDTIKKMIPSFKLERALIDNEPSFIAFDQLSQNDHLSIDTCSMPTTFLMG
jgi:hypothetical protein